MSEGSGVNVACSKIAFHIVSSVRNRSGRPPSAFAILGSVDQRSEATSSLHAPCILVTAKMNVNSCCPVVILPVLPTWRFVVMAQKVQNSFCVESALPGLARYRDNPLEARPFLGVVTKNVDVGRYRITILDKVRVVRIGTESDVVPREVLHALQVVIDNLFEYVFLHSVSQSQQSCDPKWVHGDYCRFG
jgi:hypothetical protein